MNQPRQIHVWSATLNPSSPRYQLWLQVLGTTSIPLVSPQSGKADFVGEENDVDVYLLNLPALTLMQRAALLSAIARLFKVPIYEVEGEIRKNGFPVRADDVVVTLVKTGCA